jgi:nucleotide-binding universal stress UspA family protein
MKHLLIGIDFSPASLNAFRYAAKWVTGLGGSLTLVHAYQPTMLEPHLDFGMQAALLKQQEDLALRYFSDLKNSLAEEERRRLNFEFRLELGQPSEVLLEMSQELMPDLVVLGAQGGNPWVRKLLGSTALGMIQRSDFPLLIVPESAHYHGFTRIAYATDYEEDDIRVIDEVLYFAKQNRAKLSCIHVREQASPKDAYQQELLERAYYYDLTHDNIDFQILSHTDVVEGLNSYAARESVDLMVMLTHHRRRICQLFQRSHSRKMAVQTHVPLWIYPMREPVSIIS